MEFLRLGAYCVLISLVGISNGNNFLPQPYLERYGHNGERQKRQVVSTLEFQRTVKESETGIIFQLGQQPQFSEPHRFVLASSTVPDLFTVDETSGSVRLKGGKRLDYEDDAQQTSIQLKVNATNQNNVTAVTEITLTITVTDVNDVAPVFKNRPYPFLATVGVDTPPGEKVYELLAEDPDTTADVSYRIDSGADGRFYVRTETVSVGNPLRTMKTGRIYTQGQKRFEEGREYTLKCVAQDNGAAFQQSTLATVFVKVGFRPPQFYSDSFYVKVTENNGTAQKLNNELKIESKGFQNHPISYELLDSSNTRSSRFSIDPDGAVRALQVFDYESFPREQRPPVFELNIIATETVTNLKSAAKLFIEIVDDNDNYPEFEKPSFHVSRPEDLPVHSSILEVKAVDRDSGSNSKLDYTVDDDNFYVETVNRTSMGVLEYIGIIRNKKSLDYDRLPDHLYALTVRATDQGLPPMSSTANIEISVINVDDEPPQIILEDKTVYIRGEAKSGDTVTIIQASDLDTNQISFYFSPRNEYFEIFQIYPLSGLIRLTEDVPRDRDSYVLNITAVDDGSCCGGTVQLSSEAYLNVEIVDTNIHKPTFPNCTVYNDVTVLENQQPNSPIISAKAVDDDSGENGRITYSILRPPSQSLIYFNIDQNTGDITSSIAFDRERRSFYHVTVQGNDQGNPSQEGHCTFTVSIGDVNDNVPRFDPPSYTATIQDSSAAGHPVITVRAFDDDSGPNAELTYGLVESGGYFRIKEEDGMILLNKSLGAQRVHNIQVIVKDKGSPSLNSTVNVTVTVTDVNNQPPTWNEPGYDSTPYFVDETAPFGHVIATFAATSNVDNPRVIYSLTDSDGNSVQPPFPFGITTDGNNVSLVVVSSMDISVKNRYALRLRATNIASTPLSTDIHPVIQLRDTNNKVPYFRGFGPSAGRYTATIPENAGIDQTVIEIKAFDDDTTGPNNQLSFEIVYKANVSDKFSIQKTDENTAVIRTLGSLDHEEVNELLLDVMAKDGTESARPANPSGQPNKAFATVRVLITDLNDNAPYFVTSYNSSLREDAPLQETVLTVSAQDLDDNTVFSYSITAGNVGGAFCIRAKTGQIFVCRQLDYETKQVYNLEITVSDGIFTNTTTATIHLTDANDNSPVFDKDSYVIEDVVEDDSSITPSNRRLLVTVNATDADINRPTDIRYSLLGFGTSLPNKFFEIEADTGRLYLLTSLDRDLPNGRPAYQFNVRAQDEPDPPPGSPELDRPQFGYTTVQVKPIDINDNAPIFISNLEGSVPEHSPAGTLVMTVIAIDYDEGINGTVKYEIVEGPSDGPTFKFTIDEDSGLIRTNTNASKLDRETTPSYVVAVMASDGGSRPASNIAFVNIILDDINDQIPLFEKEIYKVRMSEAQTSGSIAIVRATDNDLGEHALLYYTLKNQKYFYVNTLNNEGSIKVYRALDYEDVSQRFFNLTVVVQDADPTHTATAHIEVTVEDFNDNAPIFENPRIEVQQYENAPAGTFLAHFSATDFDEGTNAVFSYSTGRTSDPDGRFNIDPTGNVTIKKMLDREKQERYIIFILAIDNGDPAMTGTATLAVTVLDVNDNFPIFAEDYRPVVMENADVTSETLVALRLIDQDRPPFSSPFGIAEPNCTDGSDTCPCTNRPTCGDFSLLFDQSGDNFQGSATVSAKRVFDREKEKVYYMPVVTWDMQGTGDPRARTGTNTLTIQIGDVNDNKHSPGHKDIVVYNYEGMFGPIQIGTVYAADPDDWDVVDKTFTFTGPKYMEKYFSVSIHTGMITMFKGVPGNRNYTFTAAVYDRVWNLTVECSVTVTVKEISQEAVLRTGGVRLKGITAEEFVQRPKVNGNDTTAYAPSKYERLITFISETLGVPEGNVDIISLQTRNDFTDVRFTAHNATLYPANNLNSIIALNRDVIENQVGVQIEQVPIDECSAETFKGGCYNVVSITGNPALVNTNGTSFVGVEVFIQANEGCRSNFYPSADACSADYCYNGGTCIKDDWGEVRCTCPPEFSGPRCQSTHHSFDGRSYALYEPLEQCENSLTSLYIITTQENGLILYNGPTTDRAPDSEEPKDFISLELSAGYPRLSIDHGSGPLELYVDGRDAHGIAKMQRLNDGKWHRIDIIRHGREVELIVDHCDKAELGRDARVRDDRMCRVTGVTPGEKRILNVRTLLQLGGRFSTPNVPVGISPTKFDGCIKHLVHNGKLYDLTVSGTSDLGYPSGNNQCTREDAICGKNSQGIPVCGNNGICESSWQPDTHMCICKPGYTGLKCSEESSVKDLEKHSFLQWRLKDYFFNVINIRKLKMEMLFRTRETKGVLWTVADPFSVMFITLEIVSGRLTLRYNLGDGIRNLELYNRFVSNGAWHTTTVDRNGREFILKMDNGEGPNFNFTYGLPNDKQEMQIENTVFAGARVLYTDTIPVLTSDLENTCISDVRMDDGSLPMEYSEESVVADIIRASNVRNGCMRDDCRINACSPGRVCYPLWQNYECRCREHYEDKTGVCVPTDYCAKHECFASSTCQIKHDDHKRYVCLCPPGYQGEFCNFINSSCIINSCLNSATCTDDASNPNGYRCICPLGLQGDFCDVPIDTTTITDTTNTTNTTSTTSTTNTTNSIKTTSTTESTVSRGQDSIPSVCLLLLTSWSCLWFHIVH